MTFFLLDIYSLKGGDQIKKKKLLCFFALSVICGGVQGPVLNLTTPFHCPTWFHSQTVCGLYQSQTVWSRLYLLVPPFSVSSDCDS